MLASQTTLVIANAEFAADLRHEAHHDALTGLANRVLLGEHITPPSTGAARRSRAMDTFKNAGKDQVACFHSPDTVTLYSVITEWATAS